jgi:hypothetical protein
MRLYNLIKTINNKNLFKYAVIILISIIYFSNKNIKLNIFLALIIALFYISYNYDEIKTNQEEEEEQMHLKRSTIKPKPTNFEDRDDVIDYLFSIQDWYHYNPQAYEELIDNLRSFFKLYNTIKRGSDFCDSYYQIVESKKNNALNAFHSLIYTIPVNFPVMDKFNRAHKRLETILNEYLNELYDICYRDLKKKGYDITRRAINLGPKEANHYFDKDFTYQIY